MTPILLAHVLFPKSYKDINHAVIMNYYDDWKSSGLSIEQYKALLRTRG